MNIPATDVQTLKYIGIGGLAIFVIDRLFKLVNILLRQRKENGAKTESELKEISRQKILDTNKNVWDIKHSTEDIHDTVTAKKDGVPLIYNVGLTKAVDTLNGSILNLISAIK